MGSSICPVRALGHGKSQGRKGSPHCPVGPQHGHVTSHWHHVSSPAHRTQALHADQGRKRAQAHSQFSGNTEGWRHRSGASATGPSTQQTLNGLQGQWHSLQATPGFSNQSTLGL